jgi:hypothetical protein
MTFFRHVENIVIKSRNVKRKIPEGYVGCSQPKPSTIPGSAEAQLRMHLNPSPSQETYPTVGIERCTTCPQGYR